MLNATSIRHKRPFRAVTAGDDNVIVFYTGVKIMNCAVLATYAHAGVPFKYNTSISTHTRFVQDVKFSPSGELFASVGSDMKAFLYNGETGETLGELTGAHKGTIVGYIDILCGFMLTSSKTACSWSPDSTNLLTSSMDRTVKLCEHTPMIIDLTSHLNSKGTLRPGKLLQLGTLEQQSSINNSEIPGRVLITLSVCPLAAR